MRCVVLLILIPIEIAYLVAGGFIFWALESPTEQHQKQQQLAYNLSLIIENVTASFPCLSSDDLQAFANQVLEAERSGLVRGKQSSDWDFHGSIFFAMTVVTTIGYGNVTPSTAGGQLFCCIFAIFGIPFTMIMLLGFGEILKTFSKKMECTLCCHNRPRLGKVINTVVMVTAGVGFFLLIPAAIFTRLEGWGYGTALYYGIITTTTVGFGDYVAAWNCVGSHCWLYRISVGIWIYLGLAWLAGVISSMQENIESLISKAVSKVKKASTEEDEDDDDEKKKKKTDENGEVAETETELTETDDSVTLERITVDPIDTELQYESAHL